MTKVLESTPELHALPSPTKGKWVWKEDVGQKPVLEFISSGQGGDRDRRRRQADKQKNIRASSGAAKSRARTQAVPRGRPIGGQDILSKRKQLRESHTTVLFQDVKDVAFERLYTSLAEKAQEPSFRNFELFIFAPEMDQFLVFLLHYFHRFYLKMEMERRINPNHIEPSVAEKQAISEAAAALGVAQKKLGRAYCALVLGIGLVDLHHMGCGLSRVSSTNTDRDMYENLYSFWQHVVSVCFRRKDFEQIGQELGRILRSDTFNPAIRKKNFTPEDQQEKWSKFLEMAPQERMERVMAMQPNDYFKRSTPAEYRRQHPKRPAIKSIIQQRSPALVAIMPSSTEEAHWLFKRKNALKPEELAKKGREGEGQEEEGEDDLEEYVVVDAFRAGIIGEPMNQFNALTLTPHSAETEDDEADGEKKEGANGEETQGTAQPPETDPSRLPTAASVVTHDAIPDDD